MYHFLLWNSFSHGTPGVSQAHSQNVNDNDTHAHPRGLQLSFAKWRIFGFGVFSSSFSSLPFLPPGEVVEEASL